MRDWGFLWSYLRRERRRTALLGVVLLAGTACGLASPFVVRAFIDSVTGGAGPAPAGPAPAGLGPAVHLVGLFLLVGVVRFALQAVEAGLAESVAWRSTNRLREHVLDHCLRLPVAFHYRTTPGEMVERVDGDIGLLSNLFSRFVVAVAGEALLVVGVVVAMFAVEWRIGLLFLVCLVLGVVLLRRIAVLGRGAHVGYRAAVGRFMGFVEERISGLEDLKAFGAVEHTLRRYETLNSALLRGDLRAALVGSSLVWASASVFTAVVTALAMALGGWRFGTGAMTIGTVYLIFAFAQQIQEPLINLSTQLQDYQRAMAGVQRTRALLAVDVEPEGGGALLGPSDPSGPTGTSGPTGRAGEPLAVELSGVTFGYTPGHPVLRDVSFAVPAGTSVGIVGHTGSGKSTIARLLVGLARPDAGTVRLGGRPVEDLSLRSVREHVALVSQDVFVLDASVRDNIALLDPDVADERILAVLGELGLGPWLAEFEQGLDTQITEHSLSAGQAQLLTMARTLLRDPAVLVLDEASARLDPATEERLDQALAPLVRSRTSLVIAHRLSTLARVDRILVVDHGRVVEYGPRAELLADGGSRFAALLREATV
ncbi:ABC transporter ATP-binding protein [Promicromonospora sp. NPDC019610]|uniref:ABC transporter ATP-binding protein n=1 Tax=Promicromonospora sp. NPDC019610 TaxID=3364405 RepID=UPI0037A3CE48